MIGIIIFIVILFKIDIKGASQIIKDINLEYFSFALVLVIPIFFISALRWFYFLRLLNINYPFLSALLVNQTSQFISFVSPGKIGELIKIWYLKNDIDAPFAKGFMSVIIPRLIDAIVLIIFFILGLTIISLHKRIIIISGVVVISVFVLSLLKKSGLLNRQKVLGENKTFVNNIEYFINEFHQILNIKLIFFFIITLLQYLCIFCSCYYIAESISLYITFTNVMFVVSLGNILSFLPFSIAGLGTRDATYIYILSQIGKSNEEAIIFSNLVFVSFYLFGGIVGLVSYLIKPIAFNNSVTLNLKSK